LSHIVFPYYVLGKYVISMQKYVDIPEVCWKDKLTAYNYK